MSPLNWSNRILIGARSLLTLVVSALIVGSYVSPAIAGTATVNWMGPITCSDGSALSNCATTNYRIYTGPCGQAKSTVLATPAATVTTADVTLPPGKQCLDLTTLSGGVESIHTNEVSVTIAAPTPNPPGNVTVTVKATNTTAYKMRDAPNGWSFVAIGTVPAGTTCDASHSADGFNLIPREAVVMASKFDTLPLKVFAQCG